MTVRNFEFPYIWGVFVPEGDLKNLCFQSQCEENHNVRSTTLSRAGHSHSHSYCHTQDWAAGISSQIDRLQTQTHLQPQTTRIHIDTAILTHKLQWNKLRVHTKDTTETLHHCNTLQHTATHCSTLQHTATHHTTCNEISWGRTRKIPPRSSITATHWNTVQHSATHYTTLQHTATQCNILRHTATHCNTLQHTAQPAMT